MKSSTTTELEDFPDEKDIVKNAIGYCKASELAIRPKTNGYAVMFEVCNTVRGNQWMKAWCHFYDEDQFERLFKLEIPPTKKGRHIQNED